MIIYKNIIKRIVKWKFNNPFFIVENENKYEKISDYPLIKTETFGNEYFQKVPFEGKKL